MAVKVVWKYEYENEDSIGEVLKSENLIIWRGNWFEDVWRVKVGEWELKRIEEQEKFSKREGRKDASIS